MKKKAEEEKLRRQAQEEKRQKEAEEEKLRRQTQEEKRRKEADEERWRLVSDEPANGGIEKNNKKEKEKENKKRRMEKISQESHFLPLLTGLFHREKSAERRKDRQGEKSKRG